MMQDREELQNQVGERFKQILIKTYGAAELPIEICAFLKGASKEITKWLIAKFND